MLANALQQSATFFEQQIKPGLAAAPQAWQQYVAAKWQQWQVQGWPTRRDEFWKYNQLKTIVEHDWQFVLQGSLSLSHADLSAYRVPGATLVVLVNGQFKAELSDDLGLVEGLCVANDVPWSAAQLAEVEHKRPFMALNIALGQQVVMVNIAESARVTKSIQLLNIVTGDNHWSTSRLLIKLGANSHCKIIEQQVVLGSSRSFSNLVHEIVAGQNSVVDYVVVDQLTDCGSQVANRFIRPAANAQINYHHYGLNSAFNRQSIEVDCRQPGSSTEVNASYLATGQTQVDFHITANHHVGGSYTKQRIKGVIAGRAIGVCNSRVYVAKNAAKTDSTQKIEHLLLSKHAKVYPKPELEIYNDDVKCAHGSTIGALDPAQLFYLVSRGISQATAYQMLLQGFIIQLTEYVSDLDTKVWLQQLLSQSLSDVKGVGDE